MRIGLAGTGRIGASHASALAGMDEESEAVVSDVVTDSASRLTTAEVYQLAHDLDDLLSRVDALAMTTAAQAATLRSALGARVPTFWKKPLATTLAETVELDAGSVAPVHVGFRRRFGAGNLSAREAVAAGELGFVHTVRANTHDQAPPPGVPPDQRWAVARLQHPRLRHSALRERPGDGGVFGVGANKGESFVAKADDVDSAAEVLTLDDDTLVVVTATRYSGPGHALRMEVMRSQVIFGVGYDDSLAVCSAEEGVDFPRGPQKWPIMKCFLHAYRAERSAFCQMAAGHAGSPCTVADALEAFRIAEACDRSRRTSMPVRMDQVGATP